MGTTIKDQIIEQVDRLDDSQRQQVLDFARRLTTSQGTRDAESRKQKAVS
jgi:hypothetical protein